MDKERIDRDPTRAEYEQAVAEIKQTRAYLGEIITFSGNPLSRYLNTIARQGIISTEQYAILKSSPQEVRKNYFNDKKQESLTNATEYAKGLLMQGKITSMPGLIATGAFSKNPSSSLNAVWRTVRNTPEAVEWKETLERTKRLIEEKGFLVLPSPDFRRPITVTFDDNSIPILEAQEKGAFEWGQEVFGRKENGNSSKIPTPFEMISSMYLFGSFKKIRNPKA